MDSGFGNLDREVVKMKCDELKRFYIVGKYRDEETMYEFRPDGVCYDADEVDAAIAELKTENERLKKCEIWMKQHFYCEEVIACESAKNRKIKHTLWLTRADNAKTEIRYWRERLFNEPSTTRACIHGQRLIPHKPFRTIIEWLTIWENVERKCREKAEQYK